MDRFRLYLQLIRWDKPAGTFLLLWPTLTGLWLAAGSFPGWHLLFVFAAGCFLMRSAGCAVNDVADRHFDKHVQRTAQRPVTLGLVQPFEALCVAATFALLAFMLVCTTSFETVLWSIAAVLVTVLYPFCKRWISVPQAVLGVAFSMGIPMAFVATRGSLNEVTLLWWLGNLFWVLAYDTEYAMVDREDDLRLGLHTSAIALGRRDVAGVMVFYALCLFLWGVAGWTMQFSWPFYAGWCVAALIACAHFCLIRGRSREGCFRAFTSNHWLGLAMWLGVVANTTLMPSGI